MWELDCKEGWAPKNWCFQIVVLEKTLQSPLDSKEIKPVNLKGNQPWIFTGRTNAEAEAPILGPPDAKSWFFLEKTLMLEKTEGKRRGQQRMRCLDSITNSMDMILSQLQETMENRGACHAAVHWVKSWTQLSDWTTTHPMMGAVLRERQEIWDSGTRKKATYRQRKSSEFCNCWKMEEARKNSPSEEGSRAQPTP